MKKRFLLSVVNVILIGLSINLNAQVKYGIDLGINSSVQSKPGNPYDGQKYKFGKSIGINVGYEFNEIISINTGGSYQVKGGKTNYSFTNEEIETINDFSYFIVPLTIKAKFSEQLGLEKGCNVFGFAGSYYGWLIDASNNSEKSKENDLSIEDAAKDQDYGFLIGLGLSRELNSIEIYTDISFEMGMCEVVSYDSDLRNKTISLSIGVNL